MSKTHVVHNTIELSAAFSLIVNGFIQAEGGKMADRNNSEYGHFLRSDGS